MKKTMLLLLCGVSLMASAQMRFGVKGGLNYSDLYVSTNQSSATLIKVVDVVPAWQAGVMAQYRIQDFAIQPELVFSVQGGNLQNGPINNHNSGPLADIVGDGSLITYRSHNLTLPVNFQYGRDLGDCHLYAQAGPFVNFTLGGTINGESSLWEDVQKKWGFTTVDLGFGIGAGASFKNLQLGLRYDMGGSEVGKKATNSHVSTNINPFNDMKARNLSLSLGCFF